MPRRTDPRTSYNAYRNYLRAIRYYLRDTYGDGVAQLQAISDAIEQRSAYQRIRPLTHARADRLAGKINIAWQTEVALNLPLLTEDDEVAAVAKRSIATK